MRIFFVILLLFPAVLIAQSQKASNLLVCSPQISIGWNNTDPSDIQKLQPNTKWAIEKVDVFKVDTEFTEQPIIVDRHLINMVSQNEVGVCKSYTEDMVSCFFYNPTRNKLIAYNAFELRKNKETSWEYVYVATTDIIHYSFRGVSDGLGPISALERGTCLISQ